MSGQRELTVRIIIDGNTRQVVLPFEAAAGLDVVVNTFDFKGRTEWCQAFLDAHFMLDPGRKRFMKQAILSEIQIVNSLTETLAGDKQQICRKTIERYLLSGFKVADVAKMTNYSKTRIYEIQAELKPGSEPKAPAPTSAAKEELDESLAILNLAKSMYEQTGEKIAWEALPPVKRVMWIDAAVTDLAAELFEFQDVLRVMKEKPAKTLATRKAWGNRKIFVFLHDNELRISRPDVASVWKATSEDLLAGDWIFL